MLNTSSTRTIGRTPVRILAASGIAAAVLLTSACSSNSNDSGSSGAQGSQGGQPGSGAPGGG